MMDLEAVKRIAFAAMGEQIHHPTREPGWLFYHGQRTANLALLLCDTIEVEVDRTMIYTGALFHDVGKGSEPHNETGANIARALLNDQFSQPELDEIAYIIRNHNQRQEPQCTLPAQIVQDADLLDHVGPISPWLAFYWSGTHHESFCDHERYIQSEANSHRRAGMRNVLNFEISKTWFDERIAYEDEFFTRFHRAYVQGY